MPAPYDLYDYVLYWKGRSYEDLCERMVLEDFLKKIGNKNDLIDIGGGFGRLSLCYSKSFANCIVLDPSEKNLREGEKRFACQKNVSFQKGSLPCIPFPPKSFDVALLIRVTHHLKDLSPSFMEISRILKPNGYLVLEVANKVHFLSRLKAWLKLDFRFTGDWSPVEKRSPLSIRQGKITFVNHHPKKVTVDLEKAGFRVDKILSVSNFRSPFFKRFIPQKMLLQMERVIQKPFSQLFFGPSIFFLAQKNL